MYTIGYQSTSAQYYQHDMTRNEHYQAETTIHVYDNYFVITFLTLLHSLTLPLLHSTLFKHWPTDIRRWRTDLLHMLVK